MTMNFKMGRVWQGLEIVEGSVFFFDRGIIENYYLFRSSNLKRFLLCPRDIWF